MMHKNRINKGRGFAGLWLIWPFVLGLASCDQQGSPFGIDDTPDKNNSPFGVHTRKILDSLRYLPHDPADMSENDLEFYRDKPWVIVDTISPHFSADFYEDLDMRLSHMKYLFHTRTFAERLLQKHFALGKKQNYRPIQLLDEGLHSATYLQLDKTYHINPLEILLLLRNMHYKVKIARDTKRLIGAYALLARNLGNFNPARPFIHWDPIKDGGFKPVPETSIIWLNRKDEKVTIRLVIHEFLHNWGYNHPAFDGNKDLPFGVDVTYAVQFIIRDLYSFKPLRKLYEERTESGSLPTIYNVLQTAKNTDEYDCPPKCY